MKKLFSFLFLFLIAVLANSQSLYIKSFGKNTDKPIIFLHGGPGYNCANFEVTTAQKLATQGFFVIVYDRRGEGRSVNSTAKFTFKETFDDINAIYKKYGIKKAILMGHSFGGVVAIKYAEKYPKNISSIILVSAPVSLQETFRTIISTCKAIYESKGDTVNLNYITMITKMDTTAIMYSSYCFGHAMQNGFYSPKSPSAEAKEIYASAKKDSLIIKYGSEMTMWGAMGFWQNENYTSINLTGSIKKLVSKKMLIYGLYGKDDGLYSPKQVMDLQNIIGDEKMKYFDNCSDNVFTDQQVDFVNAIKAWTK